MKGIPFVTSKKGNKPAIRIQQFDHSDICEIRIGVRCEFTEAKSCIEKILSEHAYDLSNISIEKADTPIRNQ